MAKAAGRPRTRFGPPGARGPGVLAAVALALAAGGPVGATVRVVDASGSGTADGSVTPLFGTLECVRTNSAGGTEYKCGTARCLLLDASGSGGVTASAGDEVTDVHVSTAAIADVSFPYDPACAVAPTPSANASGSVSAEFSVDVPTKVFIQGGTSHGGSIAVGLPGVSIPNDAEEEYQTTVVAYPPGFSVSGSTQAQQFDSGDAGQVAYVNMTFSPAPLVPVVVIPGIGGTYAANLADDGPWLFDRGIDPSGMQIDPLAGAYDDLLATLRNVGYVDGRTLFVVDYDWRLPPGPFDGSYDGFVGGITAASISDSQYDYAVDYLGAVLKQAAEQYAADNPGKTLDAVDVIAHSTGGLVARTYIQSAAYNAPVDDTLTLPAVRNLLLVGVPNRGASKAWNPLHDNWVADPGYVLVLSKILDRVYLKLPGGAVVSGPEAISEASIEDPLSGLPDPVRFIGQYVPTVRSLLATYDFLDLGNGLDNVNADPDSRNDLLLDLNAGYDYLPAGDPISFASLTSTTVIYGTSVATPTTVDRHVGPDVGGQRIAAFGDFTARAPLPGEEWFLDHALAANGDGTVPIESSAGLFFGDARVLLAPFAEGVNTSADVTHLGLMFNPDVQALILTQLGAPFSPSDISTTLHKSLASSLWSGQDIIRLGAMTALLDPVDGFVQDGAGRRLGYTAATGPLTEIPESQWIGGADGFGFSLAPPQGPFSLTVTSLGNPHHAGAGVLSTAAIGGLVDSGSLGAGESHSVAIATQVIKPGCDNGIDDDGDGLVDMDDPGCLFPQAPIENPQCDDGKDNDGDGLVDWADPQCSLQWPYHEGSCGLGAEIAPVVLLIRWRLRRFRRGGSAVR